jgi:tRNA1Val (adenine37-N6)-methyltransferase
MSLASAPHNGDVTEDRFLNGQVSVIQPAKGYRAGMDAVLLAASLSADKTQSFAEAGCGAGAALLCAAHRLSECRFSGFERDPASLALAKQGACANAFTPRVDIRQHDIADRPAELENRFDQAFANPPYFDPAAVRAPAEDRQAAYLASTPLKDWVLFLCHVTRPGGRITLIHRAAVLAELLDLLNPRTGKIEILPVRPAPGAPAHRVLVCARKGLRRGPVTLYDGLALQETAGGPPSRRASDCYDGAQLDWS